MNLFRGVLVLFTITIWAFTVYVGAKFGFNIAPLFFGEIEALSWAGQFNYDFLTYLLFSAFWIMWRNKFSLQGVLLGLVASVLGMSFFAPHLLFLTFRTQGDIKKVVLGRQG